MRTYYSPFGFQHFRALGFPRALGYLIASWWILRMAFNLELFGWEMHGWWWERLHVEWDALLAYWIARGKLAIDRGFCEGMNNERLHHQCSKCSCRVQDATLFLDCKNSSFITTQGPEGGRPGAACCYLSVYTRNCNINNFCSTPHFFGDRTG
jgi:hypothetical protein